MTTFRGHYVSPERKFRGHLKKTRAKSPFFEGQGKPWAFSVPFRLKLGAEIGPHSQCQKVSFIPNCLLKIPNSKIVKILLKKIILFLAKSSFLGFSEAKLPKYEM